jgi:hypothetical protein
MKMYAIVLIIVAILGLVLSVFPNLSTRNAFGDRPNFNNTQRNYNASQQNFNPNQENSAASASGFSQISLFIRVGLWIVVLVIAILLMREPKKK